jgi:aminomethyltransferase
MSIPQKTPLFEEHEKAGARLIEFAGWMMPVEYQGLRAEHLNVRENVGLFDVSHMGEIRVKGPQALASLEWMTSNSVTKLEDGQAQYSLLMNKNGGIVDDLIIYCVEKNENYLVCVNASNKDKDFQHMRENNRGAEITDESSDWGQVAVQGPKAFLLLDRLFQPSPRDLKSFHFKQAAFEGETVILARTGYTGEAGVEIFVPAAKTASLWRALLQKGSDLGVQPIGLGARDTLRTEMKYPLYGNDISDVTDPFMAGLGWVVKMDAKDFLGKDILLQKKAEGPKQKWVGFKMLERGIPRHGYRVFSFDNEEIGEVTSGTLSPSLQENIGLAYLRKERAEVGSEFLVEIRSKRLKARVVATPFVKVKGVE